MSTIIRDIWVKRMADENESDAMKPHPLFWRGWNNSCHQIDSGGVRRGTPVAVWKEGFGRAGHYEVALHRAERRGEQGFILEKVWDSAYPYCAIGHFEYFIDEGVGQSLLNEARGEKESFEEVL